MRTSFHHQPEALHPNSSVIHKLLGRLPHLSPAADIIAGLRHPETARAAGTAATTNSEING